MTESTEPGGMAPASSLSSPLPDHSSRTPARLDGRRRLTLRRFVMLGFCTITYGVLMVLIAAVFADDGIDALEAALLAAVALSLPWTVLGFANATLGLVLMLRGRAGPAARLLARAAEREGPLEARTALALTIRNEDPARALSRLAALRASLEARGHGHAFDCHILSDTDDPAVAAEEERLFGEMRAALAGSGSAHYRRRRSNDGYKAGNVWEFLTRAGGGYRYFVPLDADSLMGGETVVRMVRVMEAAPRIGILQSLATGAPTDSAFGRIFQFGMRHGMRAFTMGSAWWQGDCGPFWGHNAVVRTGPFLAHCALPELGGKPPWGGPVLSHDMLEAVLIRRGGYEVRVLPVESESYEDNPVTILDFMRREQRWCNGNMQYWQLLGMPDLQPVSRFQLVQAIMMYLSAPAWMVMTALGAAKAFADPGGAFDAGLALWLFVVIVGMSLAPKIVGALAVALEPGGVRRYGGAGRFALGVAVETLFSLLMAPAVALRLTIFLGGLLLGRRVGWAGQERDPRQVRWAEAVRELWPQTLFGLVLTWALWVAAPGALPWASPVLAGLVLAIPFAVLTASPRLGAWLARHRLCAIPEEQARPDILERMATAADERRVAA